jgi:hypothetical protein
LQLIMVINRLNSTYLHLSQRFGGGAMLFRLTLPQIVSCLLDQLRLIKSG